KIGARGQRLPHATAGEFVGLDLVNPEVDYLGLAKSFGVESHRVHDPQELANRVRESLAGDRPRLFEIQINRELPDDLKYS
ncbi:MAG: thiamine pyrophosphate-dependent enzyme, partial [Pirellulales bacterium]